MSRDLTDIEVAEALGKHRRTIQRWCAAGRLPGSYKAGRSWRIPRAALAPAHRRAVDGPMAGVLTHVARLTAALDAAPVSAASERDCEKLLAALGRLRPLLDELGHGLSERRGRLQRDRELAARRRR